MLPESNHAVANLLIDIGRMRPTVKLQEGVFITDFPGYSLLVQSVNGRTNDSKHFSPLKQINDQNVASLGLAWYLDYDGLMGVVSEPIVVDGV